MFTFANSLTIFHYFSCLLNQPHEGEWILILSRL